MYQRYKKKRCKIIKEGKRMILRCPYCQREFEVDEKNIDRKLKWMECPLCRAITENPLYDGKS